jgi:uncharacterized protein (DUF488 family)
MNQIFTMGHSTRPLEDFLALLGENRIELLADVRTVPRSRHNPQFNLETLPESLMTAGISYAHLKELGGLRKAMPDSSNSGWRLATFRGYADYMQTDAFVTALDELIALASEKRTAIMCAELLWWRCHRMLISDALSIRGWEVIHILGAGKAQQHNLTKFAVVSGLTITYPPEEVQT